MNTLHDPDGPRIYREISHDLKIDRQQSGERRIVAQLGLDPVPGRSLARVRARQQSKEAGRLYLHSFQIELWRDASVLKPRRFGAATLLQMASCACAGLEGFKGLAGQTLTRRLLAQFVSNSCCLVRSASPCAR